MRWSVSDTAEYGDYVAGPQIVTDETRKNMQSILADITSGRFAERFINDQDAGAPEFKSFRETAEKAQIESTGRELRSMMSWVKQTDADYTEGTSAR